MNVAGGTYEQLHAEHRWAYGRGADRELLNALRGAAPGRAVDLGGGQGRHALWLAEMGFEVEVVDGSQTALRQLDAEAAKLGLRISTVRANIAFYKPPTGIDLAVAALLFHVPARHASMQAAGALGAAMNPGALLYMSVPGYSEQTRRLLSELSHKAGCELRWCVNHVVTKAERPRLPVSRRYETRALAEKR